MSSLNSFLQFYLSTKIIFYKGFNFYKLFCGVDLRNDSPHAQDNIYIMRDDWNALVGNCTWRLRDIVLLTLDNIVKSDFVVCL